MRVPIQQKQSKRRQGDNKKRPGCCPASKNRSGVGPGSESNRTDQHIEVRMAEIHNAEQRRLPA